MAQNEMRAMRGMPLRVRSMEGLGPTRSSLVREHPLRVATNMRERARQAAARSLEYLDVAEMHGKAHLILELLRERSSD